MVEKAFRTDRLDDTLVVMPEGESFGIQEADLEHEINQLHKMLDDPAVKCLVVDLGQAPYFGSIMIGAIMTLCLKSRDSGRKAVLCNASGAMLDIIQIMKLDTLIPYFPTRSEALESLGD